MVEPVHPQTAVYSTAEEQYEEESCQCAADMGKGCKPRSYPVACKIDLGYTSINADGYPATDLCKESVSGRKGCGGHCYCHGAGIGAEGDW